MKLVPREAEKLALHNAGFLAQKRLARSLRLNNYTEAIALIAVQLVSTNVNMKSGSPAAKADVSELAALLAKNVVDETAMVMAFPGDVVFYVGANLTLWSTVVEYEDQVSTML